MTPQPICQYAKMPIHTVIGYFAAYEEVNHNLCIVQILSNNYIIAYVSYMDNIKLGFKIKTFFRFISS